MSEPVKGQLNHPRDAAGNELKILHPARYSLRQLIGFAKENGYKDVFPNEDDPSCLPYWDTWLTSEQCPHVLVSCTGMIAASFDKDTNYRVLRQQWSYQGPTKSAQKYLQVWLADNPNYPNDSSAHSIHRMVARLHCDYTEDCITTDAEGNLVLKEGVVVDHLDTDKSNNSIFNLRWISPEMNEQLRKMKPEDKRKYINSLAVVDKSNINHMVM